MAAIIFEDPKTGNRETVGGINILGALLLGPISMLLERFWVAFFIWLGTAVISFVILGDGAFVVLFIYLLTYPIFVSDMLRNRYRRNGWIEVKDGKSTIKKCPKCAEVVKAEATVCRFCGYDFSSLIS